MPFDSEPEGKFERRIFFSARAWWQDIRSALRFLTRLPLPRAPEPAEPDFFDEAEEEGQEASAPKPLGRAVRAFPLIGALLGIAAGFAFGLADMADGFGGGQTVEKKLAIMRDSRIGAYGVMALVMVLAAKVGAVADLHDIGVVMSGLICAAATSRAAMPAMIRWLPAARPDGLGADAGRPSSEHVWTGIIIAVILSVLLLTWSGLVALLIAALGAYAVGLMARRQIGGHTGDVLGGTQQLSELLFLLALAAIR